jgi:hypothetical protein
VTKSDLIRSSSNHGEFRTFRRLSFPPSQENVAREKIVWKATPETSRFARVRRVSGPVTHCALLFIATRSVRRKTMIRSRMMVHRMDLSLPLATSPATLRLPVLVTWLTPSRQAACDTSWLRVLSQTTVSILLHTMETLNPARQLALITTITTTITTPQSLFRATTTARHRHLLSIPH